MAGLAHQLASARKVFPKKSMRSTIRLKSPGSYSPFVRLWRPIITGSCIPIANTSKRFVSSSR